MSIKNIADIVKGYTKKFSIRKDTIQIDLEELSEYTINKLCEDLKRFNIPVKLINEGTLFILVIKGDA